MFGYTEDIAIARAFATISDATDHHLLGSAALVCSVGTLVLSWNPFRTL